MINARHNINQTEQTEPTNIKRLSVVVPNDGIIHYTPGSDEHGPRFNQGSGGGARGVTSKSG